jgi:hypothetical protein
VILILRNVLFLSRKVLIVFFNQFFVAGDDSGELLAKGALEVLISLYVCADNESVKDNILYRIA